VDAGKVSRRVWGILSNAEMWKFIFIDENELLWQSGAFIMDLCSYEYLFRTKSNGDGNKRSKETQATDYTVGLEKR
jgi:hypothetical protein